MDLLTFIFLSIFLLVLSFFTAIVEVKIAKRNKLAKVIRTKGWSILDE